MSGSPVRNHRRQLRERKQRKLYSEEWALGDDDSEGVRGFSVAEKLESPKFAQTGMVREMKGCDLTVGFLQQYGFNIPLLLREKTDVGLRVPGTDFSVNDVRLCVGSKRILDVMDVNTQKNLQMTMKEWQQYYEDPDKNRLLNVISLEFSHTKLDNFVQSPEIVRQIDWVDVVWPKQLKESQTDGTNSLGHMKYPKVQKYCLMSVKNCYTDFHIDFGGTSVWYHILKGSKVFWLIPPTEKNLLLYEKWVLSGKQSDIFFGDTVEKCARVYLKCGNTFFIPTGWIHAVYTPTDSLVFGGNFLHSFGIVKQLKTAQVEDTTKVPQKFRYPFFTEMLWYVLAKYVYTLLGHNHLDNQLSNDKSAPASTSASSHIHLTHYELFGLKEIVMYLYDLPSQKKCVPDLIKDPVALIKDVRTLVERHCKDRPELAITGQSVLKSDEILHENEQKNMLKLEYQNYDRTILREILKRELNDGTYIQHQELKNYAYNNQNEFLNANGGNNNNINNGGGGSSSNDSGTTGGAVDNCIIVDQQLLPDDEETTAENINFVSPINVNKNKSSTKKPQTNNNNNSGNGNGNGSGSSSSNNGCGGNNTTNSANINNHSENNGSSVDTSGNKLQNNNQNGQPRRRRTRCKICEACQRSDCGECSFCLDMVKFGGPGRAKQTCMKRQCLSPMLPVTAQCIYCNLDGWQQAPVSPQTAKMQAFLEGPSGLMECSVCYEIAHPECAEKIANDSKGIKNEDLRNSWECPSCCKSGKNNDYKPRHFRARQKSSEVRRMSVSSDASSALENCKNSQSDNGNAVVNNVATSGNSGTVTNMVVGNNDYGMSSESEPEIPPKEVVKKPSVKKNVTKIKKEKTENTKSVKMKAIASGGGNGGSAGSGSGGGGANEKKYKHRKHHRNNKTDNTNKDNNKESIQDHHRLTVTNIKRRKSDDGSMCSSMHESVDISENNLSVVLPRKKNTIRTQLGQQILNSSTKQMKKSQYVVRPAQLPPPQSTMNLCLDPVAVKAVFKYLPQETLVACSSVCKVWSTVSVDPSLWKCMNCAEHKLTASLLTAIVRRQPEHLILDWTQIAKKQLAWTISRLPGLKNLSLQNTPIQAILALHTCQCPPLQILDLSFVRGLNDAAIREILSPPKDSRPGLTDSKSRLRNLKTLKVAGTDISDVALRYITQGLPSLIHLDLSSCQRITDAGVAQIGTCPSAINTLVELNLSSCRLVTELSLDYLSKCEQLTWLDLRHVPQVATQAVIKFAAKSKHNLQVKDIKLVVRRKSSN